MDPEYIIKDIFKMKENQNVKISIEMLIEIKRMNTIETLSYKWTSLQIKNL